MSDELETLVERAIATMPVKNSQESEAVAWLLVNTPVAHVVAAALRGELCSYEMKWTDEVGEIPVCVVHDNNSRHTESPDPHRPCLTMDPYPEPSLDVETVREALTPPMTEMLRTRFPAWANDSGGYRYAEFIDRIAGIVIEVGPAALRGAGQR